MPGCARADGPSASTAAPARRNERRSVSGNIGADSQEKNANRGPLLMQLSHLVGKFQDKAAVPEATRAIASAYDIPEFTELESAVESKTVLMDGTPCYC